ncbi:MAG: hypothetical protein GKR94_16810 [Gammaproteobacteria bacterium]|nr:hypothetical protein [Gammaproteobacteria bacterium]
MLRQPARNLLRAPLDRQQSHDDVELPVGQAPAPLGCVTAPVGAADGLTDALSTLSAAVAAECAFDGATVAAQAACALERS